MDASTREELTAAANTVVEENADMIIETIREAFEPIVAKCAEVCKVKNLPEVVVTLDTEVTEDGKVLIRYTPRLVFPPTEDAIEIIQNHLLTTMMAEAFQKTA